MADDSQPLDAAAFCRAQVRSDDRVRYLATLWAPAAVQPALFAIHALGVELARVSARVREPMLAAIRFAWWREAIAGLASAASTATAQSHPVLQALAAVFATRADTAAPLLPLLTAMIDARDDAARAGAVTTLADAKAFADGTAGSQNEAVARAAGDTDGERLAAARALGTSWGLVGLAHALTVEARAASEVAPLLGGVRAEALAMLAQGRPAPCRAAQLIGACAQVELRCSQPGAGDLQLQFALAKRALFGL